MQDKSVVMAKDVSLAELVAVRICHDLSGSIGAISNGIELFNESEDASLKNQSMNLVEISSKDAISKVIFFRHAYGSAGNSETDFSKLKEFSNKFLEQRSIKTIWDTHDTSEKISSVFAKIISNMILMAANAIIGAGELIVETSANENVKITANAKMIKISEESVSMVQGKNIDTDLNVKNIQPYLTYRLANDMGKNLFISANNSKLEILLK